MKTTVVIPNYNGIKYLENCMNKLELARKISDFEILLVDNGSVDGSLELCREYEKKGQVKAIYFQENTGFCGAVNAGINACHTPYVLLLNNDTEVKEDFVLCMERFMDTHKRAFSASAKMISLHEPDVIDDCGDLYCALGWAYGIGKGKSRLRYEKDMKIFAACGGAAIYRMEIFRKIGTFDENHFAYLEDIDVGYRAQIHGYRNYFCHDAVVYHAGSGSSGSRYNEFKINLSAKNSIYLIYKNMPFLQIVLNLPLLIVGFLIKTLFFVKKGYGNIYVKGLMKGMALCRQKEGREKKVGFEWKNMLSYVLIQLQLWWNLVRRLYEFV